MIVVVIVGILAAIAYPSYTQYTTQTRRSDAQIALTRIAAAQEKYYSDFGYYAATLAVTRSSGTAAGNADTVLGLLATSPDNHYNLALAAGNTQGECTAAGTLGASYVCGFIATATPRAGGRQVGDGTFRIDALGNKRWAKDGTNYNYKWTDK
ncbi:MAG TPA: type IV pilin protein [Sulfuricaulis sp.]|nr:type IV pilin protein [Sulfuricaulis sp.]